MAKYTYTDVIIDPEDPRVEIGAEYYFSNFVHDLLTIANDYDAKASVLTEANVNSNFPFERSGYIGAWVFIIRKKGFRKKYVPFDLSKPEVRDKLRGAWVRRKNNDYVELQIIGLGIPGQIVFFNGVVATDAKVLLEEYEFVDGSPCGELVEVEE